MEPIVAYKACWHAPGNAGRLYLKLHNETTVSVEVDSPAELSALCDLLDRHGEVSWDASASMIATDWTSPGRLRALDRAM